MDDAKSIFVEIINQDEYITHRKRITNLLREFGEIANAILLSNMDSRPKKYCLKTLYWDYKFKIQNRTIPFPVKVETYSLNVLNIEYQNKLKKISKDINVQN